VKDGARCVTLNVERWWWWQRRRRRVIDRCDGWWWCGDDDDRWVMDIRVHAERFHVNYRRKKSLNVWTRDSELLPVALDVISFCAARSREGGDDDDGDGRANISEARSSYAAWVSRGCWPKRPKAHGAAVDVGNREKGACTFEEEDILASACGVCVSVLCRV